MLSGFLSCDEQGLLSSGRWWLLLVAEDRLQPTGAVVVMQLTELFCGTWELPRPGTELRVLCTGRRVLPTAHQGPAPVSW